MIFLQRCTTIFIAYIWNMNIYKFRKTFMNIYCIFIVNHCLRSRWSLFDSDCISGLSDSSYISLQLWKQDVLMEWAFFTNSQVPWYTLEKLITNHYWCILTYWFMTYNSLWHVNRLGCINVVLLVFHGGGGYHLVDPHIKRKLLLIK